MPYTTSSNEVKKLANAQRGDAFVKAFRGAVREGTIEAADLPAKFTLPKAFTRRGEGEPYYRQVRDMVFEVTPEFKTWFSDMSRELVANRRAGKLKPMYENIEAGLVDFKALAASTRAKMRTSYTKGQTLGNSRKTAAAAKTASVKKRTTRAKK